VVAGTVGSKEGAVDYPTRTFFFELHCKTPSYHDLQLAQVADHFNAEVVAGTIGGKQDAIDYLTWTFFYRRVLQNPSYYDLEDTEMESVSAFLSDMVERNMSLLQASSSPTFQICIALTALACDL